MELWGPDSNRQYTVYETVALPLVYPTIEDDKVAADETPPPIGTNENKHHCQFGEGLTPAGRFHGGSFGVSGTPPGANDGFAKPVNLL